MLRLSLVLALCALSYPYRSFVHYSIGCGVGKGKLQPLLWTAAGSRRCRKAFEILSDDGDRNEAQGPVHLLRRVRRVTGDGDVAGAAFPAVTYAAMHERRSQAAMPKFRKCEEVLYLTDAADSRPGGEEGSRSPVNIRQEILDFGRLAAIYVDE